MRAPAQGADRRPAPVQLWDGCAVPGALCEELAAALALLDAFVRGTPPPASCRPPRVPRAVLAVRVAAEAAADRFRTQQAEGRPAHALVSPVGSRVLASAKALSPSELEITTHEAAAIAGVTEARIRQLASAGRITGRKAERSVWLLDPESVRAYRDRKATRDDRDDHRPGYPAAARRGAA